MGKLRPFVRKDSYMPNKKWIPFVIGNGYTTTDGASGPAPEYETVTGNPVSFNAITPFPLRQLEVAFSPVQDLHGYDAPWPAGGGKNLLFLSEYSGNFYNAAVGTSLASTSANFKGTDTNSSPMRQTNVLGYGGAVYATGLLSAGAYYLSFRYGTTQASVRASAFVVSEEYTIIRRINNFLDVTDVSQSFTISEEEAGCRVAVIAGLNAAETYDVYDLECHAGSTALPSWTPYSNECPISGWDSLNVEQRGKNLFDPAHLESFVNPHASDTTLRYGHTFSKAGTYAIKSYSPQGSFLYAIVHHPDGTKGNVCYIVAGSNANPYVITIADGDVLFVYRASTATEAEAITYFTNSEIQVAYSATQPESFTPYNPLSRSISITFPAMGANQWDEEWENARINLTTGEIASGNGLLSKNLIPAVPNTQYHAVSGSYTGGSSFVFAYYDADGNYLNYEVKFGMSVNFTTPANARFIRFNIQTPDAVTYNHDIAINYPATVTTYSPYTNTVYSGTVDVVTGQGEITHGVIVYDGTEIYINTYFPTVVCNKTFANGADGTLYCNCMKSGDYGFSNAAKDRFQFNKVSTVWGVSSADELKTKIADMYADGNPVTIVYPLATPIPISLTPQEVESLAGDNNLWSDANQPLTVTYRSN